MNNGIKLPICCCGSGSIFPLPPTSESHPHKHRQTALGLPCVVHRDLDIARSDAGNDDLQHHEYLHSEPTDPREAVASNLVDSIGPRGSIIAYNMGHPAEEAFPSTTRLILFMTASDLLRSARRRNRAFNSRFFKPTGS